MRDGNVIDFPGARRAAIKHPPIPQPGKSEALPAPRKIGPVTEVKPPPGKLRRIDVTFADAAKGEQCMRAVKSRRIGPTSFSGTVDEAEELVKRSYVKSVVLRPPPRSRLEPDTRIVKLLFGGEEP